VSREGHRHLWSSFGRCQRRASQIAAEDYKAKAEERGDRAAELREKKFLEEQVAFTVRCALPPRGEPASLCTPAVVASPRAAAGGVGVSCPEAAAAHAWRLCNRTVRRCILQAQDAA
jgi:hypothetical protein